MRAAGSILQLFVQSMSWQLHLGLRYSHGPALIQILSPVFIGVPISTLHSAHAKIFSPDGLLISTFCLLFLTAFSHKSIQGSMIFRGFSSKSQRVSNMWLNVIESSEANPF